MKIIIENIDLSPGNDESSLGSVASKNYKAELRLHKILRKSIDARKKGKVIVKYRAVFVARDEDADRLLKAGCFPYDEPVIGELEKSGERGRVVIVGAGPAGLFAALRLMERGVVSVILERGKVVIVGSGPAGLFAALRLMERGVQSVILERGRKIPDRHRDVEILRREGILDTESNIVFGEGGAGSYSDGKLTTRINKPGIEWLFRKLVEYGAPENILFDAKPHIGTDILSMVVVNIRKRLLGFGCDIRFGEKVVELISSGGRAAGVRTSSGGEYLCDHLMLACGNSSRDIFEMLARSGISLEKKDFAVGVRIEHSAEFINKSQYGVQRAKLPAADYRLTFTNKTTKRGTYSFCMCPGGEVVNSSSENSMLCVNGMSYSRRDLAFSNSALVVAVRPGDVGDAALGGVSFQREIEKRAFAAGGGKFFAPVARASSFLTGKFKPVEKISYATGFTEADFGEILPRFVTEELHLALASFEKVIRGFVAEGIIIGAETRTSSPVRIPRGDDFQSLSMRGLYPAGEGAGYAGGIVSSAVDGIRIADFIAGF